MAHWVYGYAWQDAKKIVHKKFIYADSQVEADEQFEELTGLNVNSPTIKFAKNRKRA